MNVAEFIEKWRRAELTERSAAQQHFLDLCELLDHPKPAEADPTGDFFTFEKGATKTDGSDGWADVWKRGYFAFEYKGKHKDLDAAYLQLDQYRAALENPPLLVTCDMDRIVVYTNFTATKQEVHDIPLEELDAPRNLEILRAVFTAPHKLKPGSTSEAITAEAARTVGDLAVALRGRGLDPRDVAHFLDRVIFCLFAEDIELLPGMVFTRLLEKSRAKPELFRQQVEELFRAMRKGGLFALEEIRRFNGNLYEPGPILDLTRDELEALYTAARLDWSAVDPSVFGTLFERGMDPGKRSQLGAHYTSREDIETLVEPVVMKPLRREWRETQQLVANLLTTGKKHPTGKEKKPPSERTLKKARTEAQILIRRFHQRLAQIKVLDPACGSGNFLYVTLQKLKDLEREVILFAMEHGFPGEIPLVGPWQLYGIEINPYAFELAQMTVWIGYLQWTRQRGFGTPDDPVLRPMDTFECKDAILDLSDPENPREPEWPKVDFIVGNPPFLGDKKIRSELGDSRVEALFEFYDGRVSNQADLCCYWFERARTEIEHGRARRVGLLATQAIRGGASRETLKRIKDTSEIFFAESDRDWILEGAAVHVSMVGFGIDAENERILDSREVAEINSNLTAGTNITEARRLPPNAGIAFQGITPAGPFVIEEDVAFEMLAHPNAMHRPNSDVLRPYLNASDVVRRSEGRWIVDFGIDTSQAEACLYEAPFEYVLEMVKPFRERSKSSSRDLRWWLHLWTRHELRRGIAALSDDAFIITPRVSKHRVFCLVPRVVVPSDATVAFVSDSRYLQGLLQSHLHVRWSLAAGTKLETRPRYTPTTCFETFPFPRPTEAQEQAIAAAARELDELRERWLNPPEWTREEILEFPGRTDGPWSRYVHDPDNRGIGTVRYPRLVPKDDEAAQKLAKRTLTNLYNQRPTWLDNAHRALDEAVLAAYGWDDDPSDEQILERLLALNLAQAEQGADP